VDSVLLLFLMERHSDFWLGTNGRDPPTALLPVAFLQNTESTNDEWLSQGLSDFNEYH
jgi:hypothetical protein